MNAINDINPKIGDMIYIVNLEKCVIVPALIVERLTRETPDDIITSFILNFGEPDKERISSEQLGEFVITSTQHGAIKMLTTYAEQRAQAAMESALQKQQQRFPGRLAHDAISDSQHKKSRIKNQGSHEPEASQVITEKHV